MSEPETPSRRPYGDFIDDLTDLIDLARHEDFPRIVSVLESARSLIISDPQAYGAPTPAHLKEAEARIAALRAGSERTDT